MYEKGIHRRFLKRDAYGKKMLDELAAVTEHYNRQYGEHVTTRQMLAYLMWEAVRSAYVRMQSGTW